MFELVIQLEHVRVTDRCNVWKEKFFRNETVRSVKRKKKKWINGIELGKKERDRSNTIVSLNFFK